MNGFCLKQDQGLKGLDGQYTHTPNFSAMILVRLKIFEWINCLQVDIYIKFRETELVEVS